MKKIIIGVAIFMGMISVIFQWMFVNSKVIGQVVDNNNDCLENKNYPCVLYIMDNLSNRYTVDYGGGEFCPLFGTKNSGFKGYIDPKIYHSKIGDKVEMFGQKVLDNIPNHFKICGGAPIFSLKVIN